MIFSIIIFVVILALLVLVHEFGHFIVAKKSGIRVDEFGLGFPPRAWGKKFGETIYSLNWIPFGGFVKIFGENPDEESTNGPDKSRSFVHKNRAVQAAVLIAGIAFNIIFAWLLLSATFMLGTLVPASNYTQYANRMENPQVVVFGVNEDSPAELAGIRGGDKILKVASNAGDSISGAQTSVSNIQSFITLHPNKEITVTLKRGSETLEKKVLAKEGLIKGRAAIGVSMDNAATLRLPVHLAVYEGARATVHFTIFVANGLASFIHDIFVGKPDLANVSGPVGIVGYVDDATHIGFSYLLRFTALISINLALINLIPFPALDGGRLLFVAIEAIIRRPIKAKIANTLNAVGFCLLILLMLVVTYGDIAKLIK